MIILVLVCFDLLNNYLFYGLPITLKNIFWVAVLFGTVVGTWIAEPDPSQFEYLHIPIKAGKSPQYLA